MVARINAKRAAATRRGHATRCINSLVHQNVSFTAHSAWSTCCIRSRDVTRRGRSRTSGALDRVARDVLHAPVRCHLVVAAVWKCSRTTEKWQICLTAVGTRSTVMWVVNELSNKTKNAFTQSPFVLIFARNIPRQPAAMQRRCRSTDSCFVPCCKSSGSVSIDPTQSSYASRTPFPAAGRVATVSANKKTSSYMS